MSDPCIISVAITGSLPRKKDNPAVPITVAEQIESTHAAFEAGATLVHLHVRNDDESPTSASVTPLPPIVTTIATFPRSDGSAFWPNSV